MKKSATNWVKSSDYDIVTAQAMFKARRYVYVIFMCHLSVEKSLKSRVAEHTGAHPPKIHDLLALCRLAELELPDEYKLLMAHLNAVSVPTRYPEDIARLCKDYSRSVASKYLLQTEKLLKWLKQPHK